MSSRGHAAAIRPVGYDPHVDHLLGIEVFAASELARRVAAVPDRGFERVGLFCLLYVATGRYRHVVDFETYDCPAGSAITVRPGQVHRFGVMAGWDGWFLVARSEDTGDREVFSAEGPHDLPVHVRFDEAGRAALDTTLRQMADDAGSGAPAPSLDALLLHELRGLLVRLELGVDLSARAGSSGIDPIVMARFRGFRDLVEREHGRWHSVAPYARELGCSQRTLSRASEAVSGSTAKAFITQRVVLEAERLLAHTTEPVNVLGTSLGFDEATNFVKWFRRETGLTPGAFRSSHRGFSR